MNTASAWRCIGAMCSREDEDYRLSFLFGNYLTLTNVDDQEMQRIIEQRLSPQYVSIHATDLKTRAYLLGVPSTWIAVGVIVMIGIGILSATSRTKTKDPPTTP